MFSLLFIHCVMRFWAQAKELDKRIAVLAREIRLCDTAIKTTNGSTIVKDFEVDDDVLAELM